MKITLELAQAITDYLATKPFGEVYKLVSELQKQSNVKSEEPGAKEEKLPEEINNK